MENNTITPEALAELKRKAEAAQFDPHSDLIWSSCDKFRQVATPQTVLALIARIEADGEQMGKLVEAIDNSLKGYLAEADHVTALNAECFKLENELTTLRTANAEQARVIEGLKAESAKLKAKPWMPRG